MAYSGDLSRVLAELKGLRERVEAAEAASDAGPDVVDRLDRLTVQVEAIDQAMVDLIQERAAARPAPIWWPALTDEDYAKLRPALREWLRDVLAVRYIEDARRLCWCWAKHPVAVDALTSLWLTWQAAYLNRAADARDAADWQTRWRGDLIEVAAADVADCRTKSTAGERVHIDPDPLRGDLLDSFEPLRSAS